MSPTPTTGPQASLIQSVCNAARSYVGTPYVHQGRSPEHGLDCIGLVCAAYQAAGLSVDLPADYSASPKPRVLLRGLAQYCDPVDAPVAGDILLLCLRKFPQHLALYLGGSEIIHSYQAAGKVVTQALDPRTQKQIHSIYRVKDGYII